MKSLTMAGVILATVIGSLVQIASADSGVAAATQADQAVAKYGFTGRGVIVAIIDRGIDYTHPDFLNPDGTTRIKFMLDMSGQNLCDPNNPQPVEYSEADINQALKTGIPLAERDAVGHGTVTAGLAAGNGRAALPSSLQYAGLAPEADLLIVKLTSEGAPAHGNQPAEAAFQGCTDQALDWVVQKATLLGAPVAALINSGVQAGPIDGTSAVSRKIDTVFGLNIPGRVYVEASGDEGNLDNHSRSTYSDTTAAVFNVKIANTSSAELGVWYTGSVPAGITITFGDDGTMVSAPPGGSAMGTGVLMNQYDPGQQFYPWQSSGPDRAAFIQIHGHQGTATIQLQATQAGTGTVDVYAPGLGGSLMFTNNLTPGRLTDYSATRSAIVTGCYVVRTQWLDSSGMGQTLSTEGKTGRIWAGSAGGPTRDGRVPPEGGVDVVAPGQNSFGAYGLNTYYGSFSVNLIQGGNGYYGRQGATSGASPITLGAVALLLQMDHGLTGAQLKAIIHSSALSDSKTGKTPNPIWGAGKLSVLGAANAVAAMIPANPALSTSSLTFATKQKLGTTSASQSVTLSNTGTAPLTITSIAAGGDFQMSSNTCGTSLGAGASCTVGVAFKPTASGKRKGALVFKDFNTGSPQTVNLSGKGQK
jgi:minor extracellular serine protease Vpr